MAHARKPKRKTTRPLYRNSYNWSGTPMARKPKKSLDFDSLWDIRLEDIRLDNIHLSLTALLAIAFVLSMCVTMYIGVGIVTRSFHKATPPPVIADKNVDQNAVVEAPAKDNTTKILLLGTDQRRGEGGFRTDVIILIDIDPDQGTVSAVSFPRDLWVKVPSLYEMKINQVYELGGFEAMAGLFQANFGVTPDYYVLTNFDGFTQFIDNRGGVDVKVGKELTDKCDLIQNKAGECTVKPGKVHMDGATALWYVRSRETTSDLDRLRREQEVLLALVKKVANVRSIAGLNEMKSEVEENVETNMSLNKALSLLPMAASVLKSPDQIKSYAIGEDQATPSWSWNGMWILLPDPVAIHSLLKEAGIITQGSF